MNDDAHFEEVNRLLAEIEENEARLDGAIGHIDALLDDIEAMRCRVSTSELRNLVLSVALAFFAGVVIGGAL